MTFLVIISLIFTSVLSHVSLQFPYPRTTRDGAAYAVWQRNEPAVPGQNHASAVCSGLDREDTVQSGNIFVKGQTITATFYGTATHLGGHCAFWYSEDLDELKWTKIQDVKDCTIIDTTTFTIPNTIPSYCADRCVLMWSWTPRESAACEIYMTCADIRVSDADALESANTDPVYFYPQNYVDNSGLCVRVDDTTHWTPNFGDLILTVNDGATPSPAVATTADPTTTGQTPRPTTPQPTAVTGGCYLNPDLAINVNAEISNAGMCGSNSGASQTYRCDEGSCCSQYGWCGPDDLSNSAQVSLYCDNAQGDWRRGTCAGTTPQPVPSPVASPVASGSTPQPATSGGTGSYVYVYVNGANYWYVGIYLYPDGCQTGDVITDTDVASVWIACESCSNTGWQALTMEVSGLWQLNSGWELDYDDALSVMIVGTDDVVTEGRYVVSDISTNLDEDEKCIDLEEGTVTNAKSSKSGNSSNNDDDSTVVVLSIIAIIALVLIVALLIGFCLWRRREQKQQVNYNNDFQQPLNTQQHQPFVTTTGGNESDTPFTRM